MAEGYDIYNYILESAEAVEKLIKDADEVMKDSLDYLKDKELRRVVVLGSGTSYHGVLGAKISMADSLEFQLNLCIQLTSRTMKL